MMATMIAMEHATTAQTQGCGHAERREDNDEFYEMVGDLSVSVAKDGC